MRAAVGLVVLAYLMVCLTAAIDPERAVRVAWGIPPVLRVVLITLAGPASLLIAGPPPATIASALIGLSVSWSGWRYHAAPASETFAVGALVAAAVWVGSGWLTVLAREPLPVSRAGLLTVRDRIDEIVRAIDAVVV